MELVSYNRDLIKQIDAWIKDNRYGIVIKSTDYEVGVTATLEQLIDDGIARLYSDSNFTITAYKNYKESTGECVADIYFSDTNSIAAYALFLARVNSAVA